MKWYRVNRKHPCSICGKIDWCGYADKLVICMRIESDKPSKNGGWLHADSASAYVAPRVAIEPERIDAERIWNGWNDTTDFQIVDGLSRSLGLSAESLMAIGCAWASPHSAFAFPMKDANENVIGIRLRGADGKKWAVKGSRSGLFIPQIESQQTIFITEGESDCAAALTIGLFSIGRPSCLGCEQSVIDYSRRRKIKRAVIVTDNDEPGLRGAKKLQDMLLIPSVQWTPICKDLREFVKLGGDASDVESAIKDLVWQRV